VARFRSAIPPPVAETIRHLHPDLKRSVKQAIRALCHAHRIIRIVAFGPRRTIYEQAAEQLRKRS